MSVRVRRVLVSLVGATVLLFGVLYLASSTPSDRRALPQAVAGKTAGVTAVNTAAKPVATKPTQSNPAPTQPKGKYSVEDYIIGKVAKEGPKSRFTPVIIYFALENSVLQVAGVGSYFTADGEEGVITADHLFQKSIGRRPYFFRKLRPLESEITHAIEGVEHKGAELGDAPGQTPDLAILKVGKVAMIDGYKGPESLLATDECEFNVYEKPGTLTSLVSGETVKIIGWLINRGEGGVRYEIIDHRTEKGESGSGFVDAHDEVFVLRGNLVLSSEEERRKMTAYLKVKNLEDLSLVHGPTSFWP